MKAQLNPQMRQRLVFCHVLFASFFLPVAVTFAVTGGLYTFKITGDYKTETLKLPLTLPPEPTLSEATAVAETVMQEQGLTTPPSGAPSIKKAGTSWQLEWTGSQFDFTLEPTIDAGIYKVAIKKTGVHRFFVQLHKAKGGWPFKFLAAGLAIGLILLFASGVMLAFASPALKRTMYISMTLGFLTFATLALIS